MIILVDANEKLTNICFNCDDQCGDCDVYGSEGCNDYICYQD